MQSISNYDNYRMVQKNHDEARKNREAKRRRNLSMTARAIEVSIVLFSLFVMLQWLAGFSRGQAVSCMPYVRQGVERITDRKE